MQPPVTENDWSYDPAPVCAPPPPGVRADASTSEMLDAYAPRPLSSPTRTFPPGKRPHSFETELVVGEVDDRGRPSTAWAARGKDVSRERLVFLSRRMVRVGSLVIVAVHMIDDQPMPLFGKILECEYASEGMHRVVLEFRPVPWSVELRTWMGERVRH